MICGCLEGPALERAAEEFPLKPGVSALVREGTWTDGQAALHQSPMPIRILAGMDDPRWVQERAGQWVRLPPLASCPACGDVWVGRGVIGPLSGVRVCECSPGGRHSSWSCWRCHSVVTEGCVDVSLWVDVPVDCRARFGQADIEARQ